MYLSRTFTCLMLRHFWNALGTLRRICLSQFFSLYGLISFTFLHFGTFNETQCKSGAFQNYLNLVHESVRTKRYLVQDPNKRDSRHKSGTAVLLNSPPCVLQVNKLHLKENYHTTIKVVNHIRFLQLGFMHTGIKKKMRFYMRLTFFVQLFFFLPVHTPQCQLMQPYTHRHLQVYQKKSVYRLKKENITSTFRRGAFGQEKKTVETHLALEFSFITKGRKNQYCRQQKSINAQIRVQNMALSLFFQAAFLCQEKGRSRELSKRSVCMRPQL